MCLTQGSGIIRLVKSVSVRGWSAPAAVTVVSFVDHTNQEPLYFAFLVRELLKSSDPMKTCHGATLQYPSNVLFQEFCAISAHILSGQGRSGTERDGTGRP